MTTVIQTLERTVLRCGDDTAFVAQDGNRWTWSEYRLQAVQFARSLIALGFRAEHSVNIVGFNTPEWLVANMGTIMAQGVAVGVYTTNNEETCRYIAQDSQATVVVCTAEHLDKYRNNDEIQTIVVWGPVKEEEIRDLDNVYTWDAFLPLGENVVDEEVLTGRWNDVKASDCCGLIYTSGTTGPPKGVMISHDNFTWTAQRMIEVVEGLGKDDRIVSYLPLSHVAAQLLDVHCAMAVGASLHFASPDALRGSLVNTLKQAKPTVFFAVPRVWEKMREKLLEVSQSMSSVQRKISSWAKGKGTARSRVLQHGGETGGTIPCGFGCAHTMVLKKIKAALGLRDARVCFTGAAPIAVDVLEYFASLDIPIFELYGQSECTGPHTTNSSAAWKVGTCGPPLEGTQTRIHDGEVQIKGRHVCLGYRNIPDSDAWTADGWLRTGDLGEIDEDGFLRLTGRLKELIITAGGENVPPVLIEEVVMRELPKLTACMVVGDRQKYLALLVTCGDNFPKTEKGESELARYMEEGLARVNAQATSRAQTLKRWARLKSEFSVDTGELTPTLKLKRKHVTEKHADTIAQLYAA